MLGVLVNSSAFLSYDLNKVIGGIITLLIVRTLVVFLRINKTRKSVLPIPNTRRYTVKAMFVLGSGGHTHEMLLFSEPLPPSYQPRIYVVSDTDSLSEEKAHRMEERKFEREEFCTDSSREYTIEKIPRSREVNQSYLSSVFSTLRAIFAAFPIMFKHRPDLLLCNGPGTCVPLCLVGLLLSILAIKKVTIVYVESFCRVENVSLSGKILYYFADHFLVQWPILQQKYPNAKYLGLLI